MITTKRQERIRQPICGLPKLLLLPWRSPSQPQLTDRLSDPGQIQAQINSELEDELLSLRTNELSDVPESLYARMQRCTKKKAAKLHSDGGSSSNYKEPKTKAYRLFAGTEMEAVGKELSRTSCKPREVCLEVLKEHPLPTNTFYIPRCVAVHRCGGCCNAWSDECVNTSFSYVNKLLIEYALPVPGQSKLITMQFINHTECWCKTKSDQSQSFHPRIKRSPMVTHKSCIERKHNCLPGQSWDPLTCQCVLLKTKQNLSLQKTGKDPSSVCGPNHVFDEDICRCVCKNGLNQSGCAVKKQLDQTSCTCVCDETERLGSCGFNRVWDAEKCACVCRRTCPRQQFLDPTTCQCECRENESSCLQRGKQMYLQSSAAANPVKWWIKNVHMDFILVVMFIAAFQVI